MIFDHCIKKMYGAWRSLSEDDLPDGFECDLQALLAVALSTSLLTQNQKRQVQNWQNNVRRGICAPP